MIAASPAYSDYGWRPSTARPCPLSLAGRRCRWATGALCLCGRRRQLLDHARRWRDADGQPILTAEPYSVCGDDLAAFVGELDALGLEVDLSGASPYCPGATVMLVIQPATRTPYVSATGTTP